VPLKFVMKTSLRKTFPGGSYSEHGWASTPIILPPDLGTCVW